MLSEPWPDGGVCLLFAIRPLRCPLLAWWVLSPP
jgi:hypothetical protein